MKNSEYAKRLIAAGCYIVREGGNHSIWFSPITGKKLALGRHPSKELPKGLYSKAKKELGVE